MDTGSEDVPAMQFTAMGMMIRQILLLPAAMMPAGAYRAPELASIVMQPHFDPMRAMLPMLAPMTKGGGLPWPC